MVKNDPKGKIEKSFRHPSHGLEGWASIDIASAALLYLWMGGARRLFFSRDMKIVFEMM